MLSAAPCGPPSLLPMSCVFYLEIDSELLTECKWTNLIGYDGVQIPISVDSMSNYNAHLLLPREWTVGAMVIDAMILLAENSQRDKARKGNYT